MLTIAIFFVKLLSVQSVGYCYIVIFLDFLVGASNIRFDVIIICHVQCGNAKWTIRINVRRGEY